MNLKYVRRRSFFSISALQALASLLSSPSPFLSLLEPAHQDCYRFVFQVFFGKFKGVAYSITSAFGFYSISMEINSCCVENKHFCIWFEEDCYYVEDMSCNAVLPLKLAQYGLKTILWIYWRTIFSSSRKEMILESTEFKNLDAIQEYTLNVSFGHLLVGEKD